MKDRPLAIFEIHAVMGKLSFKIKEFNPPMILKALEATNVEADVVSTRYLQSEVYEWRFLVENTAEIDIYLSTASKMVKCRRQGPPSRFGFAMKRKLQVVTDLTRRFNGLIYNDYTKFAVVYTEEKTQKTALVDTRGVIHWNHNPNGLRPEHMQNAATVKEAIIASGLASRISPFHIVTLNEESCGGRTGGPTRTRSQGLR
jgi:hypothetical protein